MWNPDYVCNEFYSQLRQLNIDSKNIHWDPNMEYSDCIPAFIDESNGRPYTIVDGKVKYSRYLMDFNMYVKVCWKCDKKIENPKHTRRCFMCEQCCKLKEHPNPHV